MAVRVKSLGACWSLARGRPIVIITKVIIKLEVLLNYLILPKKPI